MKYKYYIWNFGDSHIIYRLHGNVLELMLPTNKWLVIDDYLYELKPITELEAFVYLV